jgi:hypothetical protein
MAKNKQSLYIILGVICLCICISMCCVSLRDRDSTISAETTMSPEETTMSPEENMSLTITMDPAMMDTEDGLPHDMSPSEMGSVETGPLITMSPQNIIYSE